MRGHDVRLPFQAEYDKLNPAAMDVTVAVSSAGSGAPRWGASNSKPAPAWSAKFLFDDHVVCMTAKQHIDKGRQTLRAQKLARIRAILTTAAAADDPGAAGETDAPTPDPAGHGDGGSEAAALATELLSA